MHEIMAEKCWRLVCDAFIVGDCSDITGLLWASWVAEQRCQSLVGSDYCSFSLTNITWLRSFAKLKKFQKSQNILIELTPPTHPPSKLFFLKTHHWHGQNTSKFNHNNQQLLAMYEYTWCTTPKYLLVRAILGRYSKKKIQSETWTHPPTSIVVLDFWNFFLCKAPYLT